MDLINVTDVPFDPIVQDVQIRLRELGYTAVDKPDGKMGKKTEGAILNFRNRNDLPLVKTIDKQFLNALATAPKIELPTEQTTATVTEIAPKVAAVQKTWWARAWAYLLVALSLPISVFSWIIDGLGDAIEKLTPLKVFLSDWMSGVSPFTAIGIGAGIVAIVALMIGYKNHGSLNDLVAGFHDGTVRKDSPTEAKP